MKYYSEVTKKMYETEDQLREAETDFEIERIERERKKQERLDEMKKIADAAQKERDARVAERRARQKEVSDAYATYHKLAEQYARDYDEPTIGLLFSELFCW